MKVDEIVPQIILIVIGLLFAYRIYKFWPEFKNWQERGVVMGGIIFALVGMLFGIMLEMKKGSVIPAILGALLGASGGGWIGKHFDGRTPDND